MHPLLQEPRPDSQSGLRFEALRFSELCLHTDPLGSTHSGAESTLGHFWTAYMPQMESHLLKISCGKLHNRNAAITGELVHFGVSECFCFACFHSSCCSTIPVL